MRGYLGVWVPVGAPDNQDIRVKGSDKKLDKTFSATEALDSQVIYEGFSNFQDFVEKDSQYTNKLIAENAELFKSCGNSHHSRWLLNLYRLMTVPSLILLSKMAMPLLTDMTLP